MYPVPRGELCHLGVKLSPAQMSALKAEALRRGVRQSDVVRDALSVALSPKQGESENMQ